MIRISGKFTRFWSGAGYRFLLKWAAFLTLFAGTSNCPCCGQPVCPTSAASLGILAVIFSGLSELFKRWRTRRANSATDYHH